MHVCVRVCDSDVWVAIHEVLNEMESLVPQWQGLKGAREGLDVY